MTDTADIRISAQQLDAFATPVAHAILKDSESLRADLRAAVTERRETQDSLVRSNFGGWHSDTKMQDWGGDAARFVADKAVAIARRMSHFEGVEPADVHWSSYMWANLLPPGGVNMLHTHAGELWAAVFYVDTGSDEGGDASVGGELVLEDPRFPMTHMKDNRFRMKGADGQPQDHSMRLSLGAGHMVVFPAWLRHGVLPYKGGGERLSVAININASVKRG